MTNPGYVNAAGDYVGLNPPGGHTGRDRAVPVGTPLVAMAYGEVVQAGVMEGPYYGNRWWIVGARAGKSVIIRHWFGWTTISHCSAVLVSPGDVVQQGDPVALSGNSGASTGPHVHYELLLNGFNVASSTYGRVNPALYLSAGIRPAGAITPAKDDVMNAAQEAKLDRLLQINEANEGDRVRQRIVAIDDRTATAITTLVKGDSSDTVYKFEDGTLRPVTLDEFKLAMASGELYRTIPQAMIDALPGAVS